MNASNILFLSQPRHEEGEADGQKRARWMSPVLRERVAGLAVVVAVHIILVVSVVLALHRVMRPVPPDVSVSVIEPPKPLPVTELPIPLPVAKVTVPVNLPHIDLPPVPTVETPPVASTPAPTPVPLPQPEVKPAPPAAPVAAATGDSEPMVDASAAGNAKPAYPRASKNQGEQGTVVLEVLVLVDGSVGDIRVDRSSGFDRLDDSAKRAVRQWHFIPARQGGKQIAMRYKLPIAFNLNNA